MRWWLVILGILLVCVGGVWIFQGVGALKGSFMTGQVFWAWVGTACVLVGFPVMLVGVRRGRRRPRT